MKCNFVILTILAMTGSLFFSLGCQAQTAEAVKPEPAVKTTDTNAVAESAKVPETPEVAEAVGSAPIITFDRVVHNFGKKNPGSNNNCTFTFTNTGNALLKVEKKITAPCSCTVPELSKQEYKPGESGTLKVKYHASATPGPTSRYLYVHSNDQANPKIKLTIQADIVEKVSTDPKKLSLLLNESNAGCPDITIKSLDGKPFAIKGFKSRPSCVTADFDPSVEDTVFVLKPKVDLENLGRHLKGTVHIDITHPDSKKIVIAYEALPEFKVNPHSIVILKAKQNEPVSRKLWVLSNYNEDFEIESVTSKKGIIKVLGQENLGGRYKFELEITPPAQKTKQRIFSDVLYIKIKDKAQIQVSCKGFYPKK